LSKRLQRVSELIKEELSLIFLHKLRDRVPELGMLTITNVRVTPDLKNAKIYISVFEKEGREEKLVKLNELKGFIKSELASKIRHLRHIPDIDFYLDDTLDYVEKMEEIFKKIHKNDNK